jgi:hypothetical protein
MKEIVRIEPVDAVYMRVTADTGILKELMGYFSFHPPGYQFTPRYKSRVWDGKIYLFNPFKPILYAGLIEYLKKFCDDREYELEIDADFNPTEEIHDGYVEELVEELGAKLKPRDYQIEYVLNALRNNRSLSLSPTSCLDPSTIMELDLDKDAVEFLLKLRNAV